MRYTKYLEDAGFTKEQAEKTLTVMLEIMDDNFVTKLDLEKTANELKLDIQDLRSDIDLRFKEVDIRFKEVHHRIESLENRLTIKLTSIFVIVMGAMLTLQKLI
jgi:uncharacterized protein (DUF1800 family)